MIGCNIRSTPGGFLHAPKRELADDIRRQTREAAERILQRGFKAPVRVEPTDSTQP